MFAFKTEKFLNEVGFYLNLLLDRVLAVFRRRWLQWPVWLPDGRNAGEAHLRLYCAAEWENQYEGEGWRLRGVAAEARICRHNIVHLVYQASRNIQKSQHTVLLLHLYTLIFRFYFGVQTSITRTFSVHIPEGIVGF